VHLKVLERMGFVKKRGKRAIRWYGDEGYMRLKDEFIRGKRRTKVFVYECVKDCSMFWMNEAWDVPGEM
jgi:DNA-binding transcriptional ArsR family regulator